MKTRELGTIAHVSYGPEDHGILTCWMTIEFEGSGQGFGGLALDERTGTAYVEELCRLFAVSALDFLKGKKCYALRCFPTWNTPIEGLEAAEGENAGKRFTHTGFRRRMWPETSWEDPLEAQIAGLRSDIAACHRRIAQAEAGLATVREQYVNWERDHGIERTL